ncbi:TIGR03668 family PPOX class F420-dependent oxidoreductase [Gordonia sp. HNM0687]|uniref:TIGR03668 family PPOX class F420-dependent oxidoreductase n=1 Tax=Gordonia mangrovi TaxID=2665643 RepID=A0A6L7GUR5_9ACTN|nr:TIGR03668 family PPOX class F420-dependent oxidoreductase [Gordonia mangrovi]MXP23686.1 TIGR03668 family PPOX class F420-dependent oxidoreductase [Gordonia mangrovi]UVF79746.1 TIGR03668 family PPOX class F420-dependent oxidoreductase [Gordonia mangrovi]
MTSARDRFASARVARLATAGADARPHLVPVVFTLVDDVVVSCVDHKPKRTQRLRRLANIAANPVVSLLVDHYTEVWADLWWVRVDGRAEVVDAETEAGATAIDHLAAKYPHYRADRPDGPVIVVRDLTFQSWAATPEP